MNKLYAAALVLLTSLFAACGDNGVRSPDFDAVLIDILVDGPSQRAAGTQAQFRALGHFTTPPSTQGAVATNDITTDSVWSIVNPVSSPAGTTPEEACRLSTQISNAATVNNVGLVTAVSPGTVYVKASFRDKSGCKPFTITPGGTDCNVTPLPAGCPPSTVVLQQIVIHPDSQSTTPGSATPVAYCARGFYSDAPNSEREITDTAVNWTSANPAIATVPGTSANCVSATGVTVGSTTIQASATNSQGATLTDTAIVNVNEIAVRSLLRVVPPSAQVLVGASTEFFACGVFNPETNDTAGPCFDNQQNGQPVGHVVPDNRLDWTILSDSDPDEVVAEINNQGVATGLNAGTAVVNAHLAEGFGDAAPAQRNAQASLTVLPLPPCATPLLHSNTPPGATVETDKGALCLACSVEDPENVIDSAPTAPNASDDTAARMNVSLSALDLLGLGYINITVHAAPGAVFSVGATDIENGPRGPAVGFIVGRPVNDLLLAEVLAQTSVQTLRNGEVVDTSSPSAGSDTLVVELLGAPILPPGIDEDERILLAIPETTGEFDSIRLTFSPAVASALATLDVFNACAVATLPEDEAP